MTDQQIVQVLYTQSVLIIDSTSIMEKIIEKKTAHHKVEIQKISRNIKLQQDQLNSLNNKTKGMTEIVLKFSNTLNQQKQPVNIEGCNLQDRADIDLFHSLNISDGSNRSASLNITNVAQWPENPSSRTLQASNLFFQCCRRS